VLLPAALVNVPVWHVAHNLVARRQVGLCIAGKAMAGADAEAAASKSGVTHISVSKG